VCPWWLGYLLVNPLRRLIQPPLALLRPYVKEGMTVLEPGPGPAGRVVAIELQPGPRVWRGRAAVLVKC
jgi:hypothetical protein